MVRSSHGVMTDCDSGIAPEIAISMPVERDALLLRGRGQALVDRRHRRQERRRPLLDHRQHQVGIEAREQHEPRAHAHREGQAQRQPVGVEQRQHRVHARRCRAGSCGTQARACAAFTPRFRWLSVAPLGWPVVPLVYWMSATSSTVGARGGCGERLVLEQLLPGGGARHLLREVGALLAGPRDRQPQQGAQPQRASRGSCRR